MSIDIRRHELRRADGDMHLSKYSIIIMYTLLYIQLLSYMHYHGIHIIIIDTLLYTIIHYYNKYTLLVT